MSRAARSGFLESATRLSPTQPSAVGEQRTRSVKGPPGQVRRQRIPETGCGDLGVGRENRAGAAKLERNPRLWVLPDRGFNLGKPGEGVIAPADIRGCFREVADEPAPHHGVIRRVGGIEEPLDDLERFGIA